MKIRKKSLTESIKAYLESNKITYKSLNDGGAFVFRMKVDNCIVYEILVSLINTDKYRLYVFFPRPIPEGKEVAAYYLVNTLNGMPLGCTFIFDKTDNMIFSQNIIAAYDGILSEHVLSTTINVCIESMHLISGTITALIDAPKGADLVKIVSDGINNLGCDI